MTQGSGGKPGRFPVVLERVGRGGSPAKHFLTMWKEIEDEPVDGEAPHAVGTDGTRLSR